MGRVEEGGEGERKRERGHYSPPSPLHPIPSLTLSSRWPRNFRRVFAELTKTLLRQIEPVIKKKKRREEQRNNFTVLFLLSLFSFLLSFFFFFILSRSVTRSYFFFSLSPVLQVASSLNAIFPLLNKASLCVEASLFHVVLLTWVIPPPG